MAKWDWRLARYGFSLVSFIDSCLHWLNLNDNNRLYLNVNFYAQKCAAFIQIGIPEYRSVGRCQSVQLHGGFRVEEKMRRVHFYTTVKKTQ